MSNQVEETMKMKWGNWVRQSLYFIGIGKMGCVSSSFLFSILKFLY